MSASANEPTLTPGELLGGRYRILRLLGAGGMGAVYAAEQLFTKRTVALKVLHPAASQRETLAARFFREARLLSALSHPHIVQVFDMGQDEEDGTLFLAQELLEGEDLRAFLRTRKQLSPHEALTLLLPLTQALASAHKAGVLHRDVKPENIFLARRGEQERIPVLIDFGVARSVQRDPSATLRTEHGLPIGTPRYMSPEQARGDEDLDERSDLWSLAVVLYECITGRCAFDGPTPAVIYAQVLTHTPPSARSLNQEIPEELSLLLDRCLSRERAQRPRDCTALHEALTHCLEQLPNDRSNASVSSPGFDPLPVAHTHQRTESEGSAKPFRGSSIAFSAMLALTLLVGFRWANERTSVASPRVSSPPPTTTAPPPLAEVPRVVANIVTPAVISPPAVVQDAGVVEVSPSPRIPVRNAPTRRPRHERRTTAQNPLTPEDPAEHPQRTPTRSVNDSPLVPVEP